MNTQEYLTIGRDGFGECEEKRSRFLGGCYFADTEAACEEILQGIRKKHYEARHHCYARILGENGGELRFSDDGEPSGTAGKPILSVLQGAGVTNCLIVVTRYFGGTLLGTGGLVRNYSLAAKLALENAGIAVMCSCEVLSVEIPYSLLDRFMFFLDQAERKTDDVSYTDKVVITMKVPEKEVPAFIKEVTERTNAQAQVNRISKGFYPIDKKI